MNRIRTSSSTASSFENETPITGVNWIAWCVQDILEHFTVDKDNTRVAVVTYSTVATVDINDLDPDAATTAGETKCTLYRRIEQRVGRLAPYGYTATHEALERAAGVLVDSRPNAKKAVIVVTDGKSNIGPPPARVAVDILSLAWNRSWDVAGLGPQVEIYAFGIADANVAELRSIASNLVDAVGHVFFMETFKQFEEFARSLHGGRRDGSTDPSISTCGMP